MFANLKVYGMCGINKKPIFKRIKTLSKMTKNINKNKKESMNYIHCSTELVCEKCDGFGYIEEVNEFRTYLCDCQENKPIT